jgi:hypothetical protein
MAYTLPHDIDGNISLEEYLDAVSRTLDVNDEDSILATAPLLAALANNRDFLVDRFNKELLGWQNFQPANGYSSQTLMLGAGPRFAVRANMWVPIDVDRTMWDWESKLYAYSRPHDHNFSFLTVGYLGPGYRTQIFEYEPTSIAGVAGEDVDLQFLEDTELPEGKIMFYRASRDIHSQEPPPAFSMSLNLMVVSAGLGARDQYWFDLDKGKVTGYVQTPATSQLMMCQLAQWFPDDSTADALDQVAASAPSARVRAAAYGSLAVLRPDSAESLSKRAAADPDPLVQALVVENRSL